jgi:putative transposase
VGAILAGQPRHLPRHPNPSTAPGSLTHVVQQGRPTATHQHLDPCRSRGGSAEPGAPALAEACRRAEAFTARWGARYPSAVACVLGTLPELTTHLRFPREHWSRIRHSNLIERTFGETRRRVKVVGRLPGERSCLSLVWAVLEGASRGWRGVDQQPANARLLQQSHHQLLGPPALERRGGDALAEPVIPAA